MQHRYIHLRRKDGHGVVSNRGGKTIAYVVLPDGAIASAEAKCSLEDNFCRKTGRELASLRLTAILAQDEEVFVKTHLHNWQNSSAARV